MLSNEQWEDQAAKISVVEEQMLISTIQTFAKDLDLAKSETRRVKKEPDQTVKTKGHLSSQILEKQKKPTTLESDSATLNQTLELIEQERIRLSAKLIEKSTYYTKVAEEINAKLQEQQERITSYNLSSKVGQHDMVKNKAGDKTCQI